MNMVERYKQLDIDRRPLSEVIALLVAARDSYGDDAYLAVGEYEVDVVYETAETAEEREERLERARSYEERIRYEATVRKNYEASLEKMQAAHDAWKAREVPA